MLGALERGEADLEGSACRVRDARVVVALVGADRVLRVRRRLVDRDDDGAGGRIGLLAVVDRAGLEVHGAILGPEARVEDCSVEDDRKERRLAFADRKRKVLARDPLGNPVGVALEP